eukprot:jgi/Chlat1/7517/Chrsp61S00553
MTSTGQRPSYDHLIKLLLIGDCGVGKSSLLMRFSDDRFHVSYRPTLGIDYRSHMMEVNNGKKVKLQVWDTAGQERFRNIALSYYRGAHGVLPVYDVSNEESFDNVAYWMGSLNHSASPDIVKVLIGNKRDVNSDQRVVSVEQGKQVAERYGVSFFETSAISGDNVREAFEAITHASVAQLSTWKESARNQRVVPLTGLDGNLKKKSPALAICCT